MLGLFQNQERNLMQVHHLPLLQIHLQQKFSLW